MFSDETNCWLFNKVCFLLYEIIYLRSKKYNFTSHVSIIRASTEAKIVRGQNS